MVPLGFHHSKALAGSETTNQALYLSYINCFLLFLFLVESTLEKNVKFRAQECHIFTRQFFRLIALSSSHRLTFFIAL